MWKQITRTLRTFDVALCLRAIAVIFLFVGVTGFAQASSPKIIRVATLSGVPLPLSIAQDQGFFAQCGVQVRNQVKPSSDALRADLADGKIDIGIAAVDNGVAMQVINHADVVIVMGVSTTANELVAQPSIHSIAQLRGRNVIVDAVNTAFALQLQKMLLSQGLRAGRDYRMVPIGTMPKRLQAMRENKQYAATILGPPFSILARQQGFVSLGKTRTFIGPYQGPGAFVLRKWARNHADALVGFIAGYVTAVRWMRSPAHKEQVIELLRAHSRLPASIATRMYERITATADPFYEPDARLDIAGFQNVLKLRAEFEGQWSGKPPSVYKYYDPTFYRKALAMLQREK